MLQAALLGGLFNGVLSALPIVSLGNYCCCCAWVIGGGLVAAYVDQQNASAPITPVRGAQVGLLAGVVGAVVWLLLSRAIDPLLAPYVQQLLREVASNASDMPPDARAWLDGLSNYEGPRYLGGFVLMLLVGSVFSTIGGVIGAVYFRRDIPPALGGPVAPPPVP
jgi:hypothetical protein